jgi:TrmH family RNA methyltransferase
LITSRQNETLRLVRKLAERRWRDKLGLFVAEGEDLVEAATAAAIAPVELLVAGETVEPSLLAEVSQLGHPSRVLGIYRRQDLPRGPGSGTGLALWHVGDPGNVGALLRSADALGPAYLALSEGCADVTGSKALRASAGSVFRVPTCGFEEAKGRRVALVARAGRPLSELALAGPIAFVLGAERAGLPREVLDACDQVASIPIAASAESLNVAVAGSVALYERARSGPYQAEEPPVRTTSSR